MNIDVPKKYRRMYDRAKAGQSRKDAIRAHCLYCVAWQEQEVTLCPSTSCPLHAYRLGTTVGKAADPDARKAPDPPLTGGAGGLESTQTPEVASLGH